MDLAVWSLRVNTPRSAFPRKATGLPEEAIPHETGYGRAAREGQTTESGCVCESILPCSPFREKRPGP